MDGSLQTKDDLNQSLPRGMTKPCLGWKRRQVAAFPAIVASVLADGATERLAPLGSPIELAAQAWLVAFDLGEQMIARSDHAPEEFF